MATDKITIVIDADAADAIKDFNRLNKVQDKQAKGLGRLKVGYAAVAAALTGVVAVAFGKATKAAINFEEATSKFNTVFKDVRAGANALRKDLVKNFGLSTRAATELLSATGDLLSGFGFTGQAALDLSGDVNKLAVDLASFTNAQGGAEAVSASLTKALLGERESLKTYGIAIMEADVQAKLLAKGQADLTGEALRQAKAYATLEIATEQSKNAIGDFARTSNSTANQIRQIEAVAEDLTLIFGGILLESIGPLITEFGKFIKSKDGFTVLNAAAKTFASLIAVIGGLFKLVTTQIVSGIDLIKGSFNTLVEVVQKVAEGDFKGALNTIKNGAIDAGKTIGGFFLDVSNVIVDTVKDTASAFSNAQAEIREESENTKGKLLNDSEQVANKQRGLFALLAEIYKKDREELQNETNKKRLIVEGFAEATKTLIGGAFEFIAQKRQQDTDKQIALNQQELDSKIDQLEEQRDAGILTEEEYQEAREVAEEDAIAKEQAIKKKAFEQEKKLRLLEIGINTAGAIMATFARLGFPAGLAGIAPILALGATQAAIVGSSEFPSYATGTAGAAPGMALVGEQGPELVNFSGGEEIIPTTATNNIMNTTNNNDNSNITINLETNDPQQFVNRLQAQYGVRIFEGRR